MWCSTVTLLVHYFFISGAIWLYIESLYVHYAVTAGRLGGRAFKCYIPFGWLGPLAVVGAVALLVLVGWQKQFRKCYGADWRCWITSSDNLPFIFAAPIYFFLAVCALDFCLLLNIKH